MRPGIPRPTRYPVAVRLRLAYTSFWPGFDAERSLFSWILRSRLGYDVDVVSPDAANIDLEIRSVFPFRSSRDKMLAYARGFMNQDAWWDYVDRADYGYSRRTRRIAARTLWFTGENRRPPLGMADGFLGFDITDAEMPSLYFPFWMYRADWGFDSHEVVRGMTPELMARGRETITRPRTCCAFSTSREPGRLRLFDVIASVMPLDRFGKGIGVRVDDKFGTAGRYGFQACPENDVYPGYVTEKVPESWFSGNVPVWHGIDRDGWLNLDALVDTTGRTAAQVREQLLSINDEQAAWMRSQPILTREPTLEPVTEFMRQVLR